MERVTIRQGGPTGLNLMKFTLTYEGELRSNDARRKWEIRKHFHPQLAELWRVSPALQQLQDRNMVGPSVHHSDGTETVDICAPIERGGRRFIPLVRESLAVKCGLKIIFLRKEEPGRVYQGGDLDNRIKTLLDALSMPEAAQVRADESISDPIYCLMEDDRLLMNLAVETHRLLTRPNASEHEVHLLIEVDVRVTLARIYNQVLLGE